MGDQRDDIKKRVQIVDYLTACGVELKSIGGNNNVRFRCFGGHEDKHPSCDLNTELNVFTCRACEAGGDIFNLVQLKENVDFKGAMDHLTEWLGGEVITQRVNGPPSNVEPLMFPLAIPDDVVFPVVGQSIEVFSNGIRNIVPRLVHFYYENDGRVSHCVVRIERQGGNKAFMPLFWGKVGGEKSYLGWIAKDLRPAKDPRRLYGLERFNPKDDKTVVIVEGEKCVDWFYQKYSEHAKAYIVVSWSSGCGAVSKADWSPLKDQRVIIWADNDAAGRKARGWLQDNLEASQIMIVDEKSLPAKGDIADLSPDQAGQDQMCKLLVNAKEVSRRIEGWEKELDRFENGRVRGGMHNLGLLLRNHPKLKKVIAYDLTYDRVIVEKSAGIFGEHRDPFPRSMTPVDVINLWEWFDAQKIRLTKSMVTDAVDSIAYENRYDSCKDWIDSLEWDGETRIDDFFEDHLKVEPIADYTKMSSRKFWLGFLMRCLDPGCKFDNYYIFEGRGGIKKSTLLETICPRWFKDGLPSIRGDEFKNTVRDGCRLVEDDELQLLLAVSSATAKGFITRTTDEYRRKYDINTTKTKRAYIIVGTTNFVGEKYLEDFTGNRRYHPHHLCPNGGDIDLDAVASVRDQLWAEAAVKVKRYLAHIAAGLPGIDSPDRHWLDPAEEKIAAVQQDLRTVSEEFVEDIQLKLDEHQGFENACCNGLKITDIFREVFGRYPYNKSDKCKKALVVCGFEYHKKSKVKGMMLPPIWKLKR